MYHGSHLQSRALAFRRGLGFPCTFDRSLYKVILDDLIFSCFLGLFYVLGLECCIEIGFGSL